MPRPDSCHPAHRPGGSDPPRARKLIEFFEDGRSELYNLAEDIGEQPNLAAAMPRKTNELHQMLRAWRESLHAPVPTKRDPKYSPDPETGNSQARRVAQNKDE